MKHGHTMKVLSVLFLKVVVVVVALSVPVAAIYDRARPWHEATDLLGSYPGGIRICVGLRFHGSVGGTPADSTLLSHEARSFVMFPSVFWLPNIFTVERGGS